MGTPSKKELEVLLSQKIETPEQYTQALKRAEAMQQAGLIESFVEEIPANVQAQVAIYANPTLSNEEKVKRIQELEVAKGSGQIASFGGFEERAVPPSGAIDAVTAPFEAESAFATPLDVLTSAFKRQQTIGEKRAQTEKPTTINARESLRKQLTQKYASVPETDRNSMIEASLSMFDQMRTNNPTLNQQQVYEKVVDELNDLFFGEVKYITPAEAEKLDPRTKKRFKGGDLQDMFAAAYDYQKTTGTALPLYTDEQLRFLENQQNYKYRTKIQQFENALRNNENEKNRLQKKRMAVVKVANGDYEYLPTEVYLYLRNNPLGGVVYNTDRDLEIIKAIKEGRVSFKDQFNEFIERDISTNNRAINALARVRAYNELGDPDWKQTLDKRKNVLENIDYYDKAGVFTDETPLGGTTETTLSWVLRSAFSPLAVTAVLGTEALNVAGGTAIGVGAEIAEAAGVLPQLPEGESYIDPQYTRRIRERERPPLYKNYGRVGEIADNIARFKGFTGEGVAIANEMNLEGITKWSAVGGYFLLDLVDPTFDVATGTIQGTSAFTNTLRLQQKLYGAKNYDEALKISKDAFMEEVPLMNASLRIYKKYTNQEPPITDLHKGDLIIAMKDNVARNLNAERLAKEGKTFDEIVELGFGDTQYAKLLKESVEESPEMAQQLASGKYRKLLMENEETAKLLKSYDETTEVVRQALKESNPEVGLNKIKRQMKGTRTLVDWQGAEQAIKSAQALGGDVATNALKNVDSLYATPILFRTDPNIKGLENLSWITPNVLVHKDRVARILALHSESKLGQLIGKIVEGDLKDVKTVMATRPARDVPYDVFGRGQVATLDETQAAFQLNRLTPNEQDELVLAIEGLDLSETLKRAIISNIKDDGILFLDDYRRIIDSNKDIIARFDEGSITVQDVDRLALDNASRLLEARGTVQRLSVLSNNIEYQLSQLLNRDSYNIRKQLADSLNRPVLPSKSSLTFEQLRIIDKYNSEMGTFSIRSEELFQEILNNKQDIVARYLENVPDRPLEAQEILGLMIIGERQASELGKAAQLHSINESTNFLLTNLFIRKGDVPDPKFSQSDKFSGIQEVYQTDIFNGHGQLYIQEQLLVLQERVIDDPLSYWAEVKSLIDDINDAIQNPTNRLREVDIETEKGIERFNEPIVDDTLDATNVLNVTDELLDKKMGNLTFSTYFAAESERVVSRLILETINEDLTKLSVKDMPEIAELLGDGAQKRFEAMVKDAALQLRKNNKIDVIEILQGDRIRTLNNAKEIELVSYGFKFDDAENEVRKILKKYFAEENKTSRETNKLLNEEQNARVKREVEEYVTETNLEHKAIIREKNRQISLQIRKLRKKSKDALKEKTKNIPRAERGTAEVKKITAEKDAKLKKLRKQRSDAKKVKASTEAAKKRKEKLIKMLDDSIEETQKAASRRIRNLKRTKGPEAVYSPKMLQAVEESTAELRAFQETSAKELEELRASLKQTKEDDLKRIRETLEETRFPLERIISKEEIEEIIPRNKFPDETAEQYVERIANETRVPALIRISDAAKQVRMVDTEANKIIPKVQEYAELVLRNNNLLNKSKGTVNSMQESIDALFKNDNYAQAIFGVDRYNALKRAFANGGQEYRRSIMQAVIQSPEDWAFIKKTFDVINQSLYVTLLGWRPASHVRNTTTAATIVYQTTGEVVSPSNIRRGLGVVWSGQSINAPNYGKIVLRTPDGKVYTNGDLFKILQKSGVRNQFQFLQSQLRDGSDFVKQLNRMRDDNIGDQAFNFLRNLKKWVVEKPLYLQTQEDFIFRAAVLTRALEQGRSVDEAANLARRSMFDYSDMPQDWQNAAKSALVFSSFQYQNIKNGLMALTRPQALMRYARMLRLTQSSNTLLRAFNDDKQLPYQMYYPIFAQNRVVYEINTYNDKTAFLMAPPIPAIDSVEIIGSGLVSLFKAAQLAGGKEVDPFLPLINLLQPIYKEILPLKRKYESSLAKPEVVTLLSMFNNASTPNERAAALERHAGGRVRPRPAKPNDKNAIDGYVYPLSASQRKKLYHQSFYTALVLTGLQAQVMDYVRLFSPEGTTQANQSSLTRLGAFSGLYSISQVNPENVQQQRNMKLFLRYLNTVKTGEETASEAAIFRDTNLIQPSEE